MSDAERLMKDFMNNQNKSLIGEKVTTPEPKPEEDGLPDAQKAEHYDTSYSDTSNDKAYLAARKIISALIKIPILLGGLAGAIYLSISLLPIIINYLRKVFIILAVGSK